MPTRAEPPDDPKLDTTSMIDVVFLLIVFFVCIDFKTLEAKLAAWLPRDRGGGPATITPVEQLTVRVHVEADGTPVYPDAAGPESTDAATGRPARFALAGHRVRWEVGPQPCSDRERCRTELARIAAAATSQLPDPATGGKKLMACVVEGMRGTRYDDIARTVDLCRAAGFTDVQFGTIPAAGR